MPLLLLFLTFQSLPCTQAQTIVQFKTPLGALDVELFDKDKPVTVGNFLNYVTNGIYKDMFFHRWVPGFVIQGGGFAVARRGTTNAQFTLFKNLGNITNEYAVGQKRSNVYGTIAMAKLGNDPNSASSEWFFNLADNSQNLDRQNGGFTVFGRVIAGTNVLERFNKQNPENGVFSADLTSVTSAFSALPVLSTTPTFNDLAYVDIVVVSRPSPPSITLQPQSRVVVAGEPAEFSVSASGSQILRYQWSFNASPIPNATNALLRLPETATTQAGRYTVNILNDLGTATSTEALLEVRLKLDSKVTGSGAIIREPTLPNYALGTSIALQAIPSAGWRFSRWDGGSNSTTPLMQFTLLANQTITAVFEQIPVEPFSILVGVRNAEPVELSIPALDRAIYQFETSSDLRFWARWLRVTNSSGTIKVVDPRGATAPTLFYRSHFAGFAE